ncbi:MAG: CtsR family transcriptional regulator [Clostridia bacterium]|nr:CtsR family transcriptional regulator [Clostridia bacterium]
MLISDSIAQMIEEMLSEGNGEADFRRNDLASRLGCVPSQINYVITSRFTPERGYMTESRRGGGGYVRIIKISMDKNEYLMHFFHAIGNSLEEGEARAYLVNLLDREVISPKEAALISSVVLGTSLDRVPPNLRPFVRADLLKHATLALIRDNG